MRKYYFKPYLLFFAFLIFLITSCDVNNTEGIPSYIQIDTAFFEAKFPNIQGSSSSKITDVWVYVDNQIQGVYELPVIFPILESGETNIFFRAGILMNGMVDTRIYYPFYDRYNPGIIKLNRGEITKIEPSFNYISPDNMTFAWIENFENFSSSLSKNINKSDTNIFIGTGKDVFEGKFSGKIVLEDTRTFFEIRTNENFNEFSTTGRPIYLEMDFKIDTTMTVGVEGKLPSSIIYQSPVVTLNAKKDWTKIYINLTQDVADFYSLNAEYLNIYFSGGFSISDKTIERKEFLIDNIKLVY